MASITNTLAAPPRGRDGAGTRHRDNGGRALHLVVAERSSLIRQGLEMAFASDPGIHIAARTSSGAQALAMIRKFAPDVVLLDTRLNRLGGLETLKHVRLSHPAVHVIVMSLAPSPYELHQAVKYGAHGFISLADEEGNLGRIIRSVVRGQSYFGNHHTELSRHSLHLTSRELQVLDGFARGLANKEIAEELSISIHTVKTFAGRLLKKLKCPDRSGAVGKAFRAGLINVVESNS